MNHKLVKKVYAAVCISTMLTTGAGSVWTVSAAETAQERIERTTVGTPGGTADFGRGNASITIRGNEGQTLEGKQFQVYKLFHAENSAGLESINYTFNEPYANALKTVVGKKISKAPSAVTEYEVIDYIQTLNTDPVEGAHAEKKLEGSYSDYRYFVEELRNQLVKDGVSGDIVNVTKTKADNSIVIGGIDFGYYIVDEVTTVEGTHSAASLCIVNTANPEAGVNIKSDYPSIIKKIQEDDKRDQIGIDGWNDIADFEIGQTVPYKYESDIPNINGYDTYYYTWHDIMDEALTFQSDSVKIVIQESEDSYGKKYELNTSEFKVVTNPGNGETFKVEINDIKAIVDREFNNKNELNENTYGQRVILTYDAVLNDKAAQDTGRPGFENDVRLEFSNDADHDNDGSTGFTPWDTVVCFTYKINGLKTNNHDLKLEGAKFRLYSDEKCENEVYLKAANDGYIVINRDSVGGSDHTGGTEPKDAVEMTSNKEGVFKIYGLDGGTYYLKETKAPAGYRPLLDPIVLQITPSFTTDRDNYVKGDGATDKTLIQLNATAHIKEFLEGAYKEQDVNLETDMTEGSANITVVNTVGKKLPITGSYAMIIMVGAGTLMVLYSFARRKKK